MERTLVIIKPDGVQRGLIGEIIGRLERRGLKIVGMKLTQIDEALARRHYGVHEGKPFFEGLIQYITSAPVVGDGARGHQRHRSGAQHHGRHESGQRPRRAPSAPTWAWKWAAT